MEEKVLAQETAQQTQSQKKFAPPTRPVPPRPVQRQEEVVEQVQETNQQEPNDIVDNNKKQKKERPAKQKKQIKKLTKKQLIILISSLVGAVVLALGVFGLVVLIQNGKEIARPNEVNVFVLNEKTFIEVPMEDRAVQYTFVIKKDEQTSTIVSSKNTIDVTEYIKNAGKYEIMAKYVGKRQKANSKFSTVKEYINKVQLSTPVITYDESTKTFSWVPVKDALSYKLRYGAGQNECVTISQSTNANITYSLASPAFFTGKAAGLYVFSVEAIGGQYHNSSLLSNKIEIENGTKLAKVTNIAINSFNIISFNSTAQTKEYSITITLNDINQTTRVYTKIFDEIQNAYSFDISAFGLSAPVKKIEIVAKGDGNYSYDSDAVTLDI